MVYGDIHQYCLDAIRELRQQMYAEPQPLLLEYSEWPHFQAEFWLIAFVLRGDATWVAVGRADFNGGIQEFKSMGLVCSDPYIRHWTRPLSEQELGRFSEIVHKLRAAYPFEQQEGIFLDGVLKSLLLQESEELPVVQSSWNMDSPEEAVQELVEWLEVLRLRRYMRG